MMIIEHTRHRQATLISAALFAAVSGTSMAYPAAKSNARPETPSTVASGMAMAAPNMPQLKEIGKYLVTGQEDWKARTGFGKNSGMVAMMAQMMVGGSGMEGMKMAPMKMSFGTDNFTGDKSDSETATTPEPTAPAPQATPPMATERISVPPATASSTPIPASPATPAPKAPSPPVSAPAPIAPPGPAAPVPVTSAAPPARSTTAPAPTALAVALPLKIVATIKPAKYGDNTMSISIADANGTPVAGAKIETAVAMTSMDMGTAHPAVKDLGNGNYRATIAFTMSGPWRVTLKVTATNATKPQVNTVNVDVK